MITDRDNTSRRERPRVLVPIMHPVGGIQTWCKYYYKHPRFRGFDLELLAPTSNECAQLERAMQPLGITVRVTPATTKGFAAHVWRAISSKQWDLVHAHGFTAAIICAPIAKIFGRPCLVTQHDVILDDQYTDVRGKFIRAAIRASLALATSIHSVTESAAANLRKVVRMRTATCRRITVIQNGIDTKPFYEAPTANLRAELGLESHDFIVGFFGRFMNQKGFGILIQALRHLLAKNPPLERRVIVVAVGSGAFRDREQRMIAAMGIEANVRFVDFRPNIADLIKGVDVIAVPSLWEACGLIAMEALVCGTPLICSDCDGLAEVTEGTPATRVPVANPEALAEAIALHVKDDHRPAAQAFAPIAAQRFSAEPAAAKVADLYRELIGRGH